MVGKKKRRGLSWLVVVSFAVTSCVSTLPLSLARAREANSLQRAKARSQASYPVLSRYATDLTEMVRQRNLKGAAVDTESVDPRTVSTQPRDSVAQSTMCAW